MYLELLSNDYQKEFNNDPSFYDHVVEHLSGLAKVIEDCDSDWQPKISELVAILPESIMTNKIVAAGMAYGSGLILTNNNLPGPAILLYGAALNTIGELPNTKLRKSIAQGEELLQKLGINTQKSINEIINAAKERASFDRVGEMLRQEFKSGLIDSGLYEHLDIDSTVKEIVNITHDVRHKGLIRRIIWKHKTKEIGGSDTDIGYLQHIVDLEFKVYPLHDIVEIARNG